MNEVLPSGPHEASIKSALVKLVHVQCESRARVPCTMYYLDVSLDLPLSPNLEVSTVYLKKNILQSVRQLFGQEGAKHIVDIIKYNSKEHRFVLRCTDDCYVRLRAALTLAERYEGHQCTFVIHRASSNLLSFVADSRTCLH